MGDRRGGESPRPGRSGRPIRAGYAGRSDRHRCACAESVAGARPDRRRTARRSRQYRGGHDRRPLAQTRPLPSRCGPRQREEPAAGIGRTAFPPFEYRQRFEAMTGSAQRSRGRPPLPRDRIVDAAVHIVDVQGADALSMRTLAQQLNSGTATLYRHFANRSELIAEVVDRVFGEVDFDTEELIAAGWQQACKNVAHAMFGALRRHANVSRLLIEQVPVGPNAMLQRERLIALLLGSGFPPKLAARSDATLARYVLGFAIQLTGPETADHADLSKVFHGVNPEIFPATTRVADHLPVPLEDEFDFGLDLIIDGLTQQHD